jgi:hypothetical protein
VQPHPSRISSGNATPASNLPVTATASVQQRPHPGPQHVHRDDLAAGLVVVDRDQRMPHSLDSGISSALAAAGPVPL